MVEECEVLRLNHTLLKSSKTLHADAPTPLELLRVVSPKVDRSYHLTLHIIEIYLYVKQTRAVEDWRYFARVVGRYVLYKSICA